MWKWRHINPAVPVNEPHLISIPGCGRSVKRIDGLVQHVTLLRDTGFSSTSLTGACVCVCVAPFRATVKHSLAGSTLRVLRSVLIGYPASDRLKVYEVRLIKWTVAIHLFLSIQIWLPVAFLWSPASLTSELWRQRFSPCSCRKQGILSFWDRSLQTWGTVEMCLRIPRYLRRTFDRELSPSPHSTEKRPSCCSADATSPLLSSPLWVSNPYEQMDGGETQQLVAPLRHPPIVPLGVLIPPLPPPHLLLHFCARN